VALPGLRTVFARSGGQFNWRGNRQGFPKEVLDDLLMLHETNDMLVRHAARGQRQTAMPGRAANTPHPQRSLGMLRR
jgi:hypothetical protein